MQEFCKFCSKIFSDQVNLLEHFEKDHLSQLKSIPCIFCRKKFANFDDLLHHIGASHKGISSQYLEKGTLARETKKQLGNYLDENKKGVAMECPECFEMFSDVEKINEHAKKEHNQELNPLFLERMKKTIQNYQKESPPCDKCLKVFPGVIFTRIDNKIQNVCLDCYEEYFGANALARLTIGTNEDVIKKMRTPKN